MLQGHFASAGRALAVALLLATPSLCWCGPVLDELVTPMRLDQRSGPPNLEQWRAVTADRPLGQTIVTGPSAHRLCRIAIRQAWWNREWTEEESLTLTLWDSPKKQRRIAACAMPYRWRRWEGGILMFPLWCDVRPETAYYFELTVAGGNGRIEGINVTASRYDKGQSFEAGEPKDFDLFFETHTKSPLNPDADYGRLFRLWNLDYPGLEQVRALVAEKRWEAASYALVDYYEQRRPDLIARRAIPATRPADFETRDAELALTMKMAADEEGVADIGPDWNHYAIWPTRGGVGLTRGGIRKFIAQAYLYTGDAKYAQAWNDVNLACLRDQPNPVEAGALPATGDVPCAPEAGISGGTMWHSLSIGARAGFDFHYYSWFVDAPQFTKDVRAAFIFNLADMTAVLRRMKAGGNWTTQNQSSLIEIAQRRPEYRDSRQIFEDAFGSLVANLLDTVHPDGPLKEATFNYHLLTLNRFTRLLESAERLNMNVPPEARQRVVKAAEYATFAVLPDLTVPLWGDSNPVSRPGEPLLRAAEMFKREDMRWVATEGAAGHPPAVGSVAFPTAGYFVMRSGWTRDARYLALHNGHSTSHGHNDALGIILAAYGRQLVIDPGIYIYGTPHAQRLTRTQSHSTVTIDDRDTLNANGRNTWASSESWDYFSGTNAGYKGAPQVRHQRQIIFAKGDYWVIRDSLTGPGRGRITSRLVLSSPEASLDGGTACTTHEEGGNLAIIPADSAVSARVTSIQGASSWSSLADLALVELTPTSDELPVSWCTALVPYRGAARPDLKVRQITGEGGHCIEVRRGADRDLFLFQSPGGQGSYDQGRIRLDGEAALVRYAGERLRSVSLYEGSSLRIDGAELK